MELNTTQLSLSKITRNKYILALNILMIATIIGMIILNLFEGLNEITRIIGMILVICYLFYLLKSKSYIPKEILLYLTFVLFTVPGYFVATDKIGWFGYFKLIFQIGGMMLAVAGITKILKNPLPAFYATIVGNLFIFLQTVISGELFRIQYFYLYYGETNRVIGWTNNPNGFSFGLLYALMLLMWFWKSDNLKNISNILKNIGIFILIIILSIGIIFSGSRKGYLSIFVFLFSWIWFCNRKLLRKKEYLILIVFIIISLFLFNNYVVANTFLGERFLRLENEGHFLPEIRQEMYIEAFKLFLRYPIAGVGLANFATYSGIGMYSHSDYAEIISTTGLIGAILYFSIYIVLWRKLNFILKNIKNDNIIYQTNLFKAVIITFLFLGFGRPAFLSTETMLLLAAIIGYTEYLKRTIIINNNLIDGKP